jgi:quercetin dioxygenase-like cupin family protein
MAQVLCYITSERVLNRKETGMTPTVSYHAPGTGQSVRLGPSEYLTELVGSEATGGSYTMFEVVSSQDSGVPLHKHAWDEGFYVLEGKYEISYVDEERDPEDDVVRIEALPGSYIHVPANRLHAFQNLSDGYSKMLSINQPVGLEPVLREAGVRVAGPGAEPEDEPLSMEDFSAVFVKYGVEVDKERLAASQGVGAWKKDNA